MKIRTIKRILTVIVCTALCVCTCVCLPAQAAAQEPDSTLSDTHGSVPQITVTTQDGNGCSLEKADGYVPAHITITDTDGSTAIDDAVSFKVRGNTTSLSWITKKPFTFKFEKKKDVLGMGKGKKWALIANAFDSTLLRNFLAFETAKELDIPFTSNQKYVELWVDGSYRGSYVLYEPVQQGSDRVDIDIKGNDGMKDFLVEFESMREEEDTTYFTAEGLRFIASEPETPSEEQLNYIRSTMTDIIQTIKSGSQEQVAEKVDMPSFVKYYLLNEYFKTYDFSVSSVFFYYKDGKLYAGPPWDYDLSMGNTNADISNRCKLANSPQGVYGDRNIYKFLANKGWFKELVKAEYEADYDYFCNLHTDGGVLDTLRSTYNQTIRSNYNEAGWNVAKWWINIQRKPDKTYGENYNFLKNWLAERNAWFEEYLEPFYREYLLGDADGDGSISIADASLLQRVLAGVTEDPDAAIRGNVTDQELSISDATEIQKYLADMETPYKIGGETKARFR